MNRDELIEVMARQSHAQSLREINSYEWANWSEAKIRDRISANWPYEKNKYLARVRALLDRLERAGLAVVPVEPTEAMLEAGGRSIDVHNYNWKNGIDTPQKQYMRERAGSNYRAMLDAAK